MKNALVIGGLMALAAPYLATPALAGELIPELVPAEARWLVHIDLEAVHKSSLFKIVSQREEFLEHIQEIQVELGVSPLEVVHSISVYSTDMEPESGVAIVAVSQAATALLEKLQEQEGYQARTVAGRKLHSWSDDDSDDERVYAYVQEFEGISKRLVFISNKPERVMSAVDVLDGKRRSITEVSDPSLSARPRPGSFAYFETSENLPGMEDMAGQVSAIAALTKGLRFDLGEAGGVLSAELIVTTADAGSANKITSVLKGVTALAGLLGDDHGGQMVQSLVNALRFTTNGNEVGIEFMYDSRRLMDLLEEIEEMEGH